MIFSDLFSLEVGSRFRFVDYGSWLYVTQRLPDSVVVAFCINPQCQREVKVNRNVFLI